MIQKRASVPHLENIHDENLLNRKLVFFLDQGETRLGRLDADVKQNVLLNGLGIHSRHCIKNAAGKLSITVCAGARVIHNGVELTQEKSIKLGHNDRLRFGSYNTFRVVLPGSSSPVKDEDITYQYGSRDK